MFRFLLCNYPRILTRAFATATETTSPTTTGATALKFTLASPDAAFYTNSIVKQVDVPTQTGVVGVLANHVPIIASLKPGVIQVLQEDGNTKKLFVSSGSISMNTDGSLQVLAEEVVEIQDIDQQAVQNIILENQKKAAEGSDVQKAEATIRIEVSDAMLKASSA